MKVGPHVMTHSHAGQHHHDREVVPRVGSAQAGGNLKLIQCQLMLLLHARRCQQRHELMLARNGGQGEAAGGSGVTNNVAKALLLNCPVRHCRAMKEVLDHMKTCRLGGACTYQHCTTSLRILSHWTNCTIEDCPLCMLVRMRMTRAKEWEATLPRSSRYTLLAAALRSSQTPRPVPPNCQVAEQAQEGQSGVPCQEEEDMRRQWPVVMMNDNQEATEDKPVPQSYQNPLPIDQNKKTAAIEKCGKCRISAPGPSLDQVRKAYEQLGIPCPKEALQRLMATIPSTSRRRSPPTDDSSTDDNSMDVSDDNDSNSCNGDQGVYDCYCAPAPPRQVDQQPVISSTTTSTVPLRFPFKSSR